MKFLCDECGTLSEFKMNDLIKDIIKRIDNGWRERMIELKARVQTLELIVEDLSLEWEMKKSGDKI